jgi:hypothetical protein
MGCESTRIKGEWSFLRLAEFQQGRQHPHLLYLAGPGRLRTDVRPRRKTEPNTLSSRHTFSSRHTLSSRRITHAIPPAAGANPANWPVTFTLAALATWRMTHLLTEEDGPADLVLRLRQAAGESQFGQVMDCFYCASMWVALPIAALITSMSAGTPLNCSGGSGHFRWSRRAATWLALSGAACLLEQAARARESAALVGDPDAAQASEAGAVRSHRRAPEEAAA